VCERVRERVSKSPMLNPVNTSVAGMVLSVSIVGHRNTRKNPEKNQEKLFKRPGDSEDILVLLWS
jgi:hypothetical protein